MKCITSSQDVKSLGIILAVWAHPDDETFCCGAIMAEARKNGQRVVCITATKGEQGIRDEKRWPADKVGEIRAEELKTALKTLGVREHHWLGYKDGKCQEADAAEASNKILGYIKDIKPDTVLTFGAEGMTGHPDHQTVSAWVGRAIDNLKNKPKLYHAVQSKEVYNDVLKEADKNLHIFYNIDKPPLKDDKDCDICYCLSDENKKLKLKALAAMPSQYADAMKYFNEEMFRCECFVKAES